MTDFSEKWGSRRDSGVSLSFIMTALKSNNTPLFYLGFFWVRLLDLNKRLPVKYRKTLPEFNRENQNKKGHALRDLFRFALVG